MRLTTAIEKRVEKVQSTRSEILNRWLTISVFRFVRTRRKRDRICTSKPGAIRDSSSRMIKESNFHLVRTYTILNINQNFLNLMRRGKMQVDWQRQWRWRLWRRERSKAPVTRRRSVTASLCWLPASSMEMRTCHVVWLPSSSSSTPISQSTYMLIFIYIFCEN